MKHELTDHQVEIISYALQHGGVLAAPFGHFGDDSLVEELPAHVKALEADGLVTVTRDEHGDLQRIELTPQGQAALGVR